MSAEGILNRIRGNTIWVTCQKTPLVFQDMEGSFKERPEKTCKNWQPFFTSAEHKWLCFQARVALSPTKARGLLDG